MLVKQEGLPEEGELVLCTITSIHYHSVFVNIMDYDKTGLIHISEVSPGRIRNIRDFVVEGKKVVCKVIRINKEKGHIDLSLRRVNDSERRKKVDSIKQDQKCKKIIEFVANQLKKNPKELYDTLSKKILEKYEQVYDCFEDIVEKDSSLAKFGIDSDVDDLLTDLIKERIKPKEVVIKEYVKLISNIPEGVDVLKDVLSAGRAVSEAVELTYEGGGKYKVSVKSPDYKTAEKLIEKINSVMTKKLKGRGVIEFNRLK